MKKISKIFCGKSDTDAVEPRRSRRRSNRLIPERTIGQHLHHLDNYALWATKLENGYLIQEAHFLPSGNLHDIVIRFEGENGTNMIVAIDNNIVIELNIENTPHETTAFHLNNGIVVDFEWDLRHATKYFGFFTKVIRATGSTSNNSGNNGEPTFNEDDFGDEGYDCLLDVYAPE